MGSYFQNLYKELDQKYNLQNLPDEKIDQIFSPDSKVTQEVPEVLVNFQQEKKAKILRFYIESFVYDLDVNYSRESILHNIYTNITNVYKTQNLTKVKFIYSFLYNTIEVWYKSNPVTIQQALRDSFHKFLYIGIQKRDCEERNVKRTVSNIRKLIRYENANKLSTQRLFRKVYDQMKAEPNYFYPWIKKYIDNEDLNIIDDEW